MNKPEIEASKIVYEGYFDLRVDTLKKKEKRLPYTVLMTKCNAVNIIGCTGDGKILVIKEYRHPIQKVLLSFPGGRVEENEDLLDAAKRELLEETGYSSDSFKIISSAYPLPAICDQSIAFVLAENIYKVKEQKLDDFEFIEIDLLRIEEIEKMIQDKKEIDGIFLTGLYLFCLGYLPRAST